MYIHTQGKRDPQTRKQTERCCAGRKDFLHLDPGAVRASAPLAKLPTELAPAGQRLRLPSRLPTGVSWGNAAR